MLVYHETGDRSTEQPGRTGREPPSRLPVADGVIRQLTDAELADRTPEV